MSLLSKLFSGNSNRNDQTETVEYQGFRITPEPMKEGARFRLSARVEKDVGGDTKVHKLVRADVLDSREDAVEAAISKAKQVIDEQGDRLFS